MNIRAVIERLELAGYRFTVEGDTLRGRRVFEDATPEEELRRLLGLLKARKAEALAYLRKRQEPHPGDCVCPDCLHSRQEAPPAGALLPGAHPGSGPTPLALPASLRRDGTCWTCGGSRWWASVHGALVCATCHSPADPFLVARWVGPEEAAAFKKAARADSSTRRKSIPREMPAGGERW
jgi:hypothetical protein